MSGDICEFESYASRLLLEETRLRFQPCVGSIADEFRRWQHRWHNVKTNDVSIGCRRQRCGGLNKLRHPPFIVEIEQDRSVLHGFRFKFVELTDQKVMGLRAAGFETNQVSAAIHRVR